MAPSKSSRKGTGRLSAADDERFSEFARQSRFWFLTPRELDRPAARRRPWSRPGSTGEHPTLHRFRTPSIALLCAGTVSEKERLSGHANSSPSLRGRSPGPLLSFATVSTRHPSSSDRFQLPRSKRWRARRDPKRKNDRQNRPPTSRRRSACDQRHIGAGTALPTAYLHRTRSNVTSSGSKASNDSRTNSKKAWMRGARLALFLWST